MVKKIFLEVNLTRAFFLFFLGVVLALPVRAIAADEDARFWALYSPQSQHPWNRVYRALYDMTLRSDQGAFSWPESQLHGRRYRETTAALDHFLNTRAERLARDPVKRALFQNDLWKFFNWTLQYRASADQEGALNALRTRLVRIMRRVALTRGEIEQLPDTYSTAIRSRMHPLAYDADYRQKAFLPPDLWDEQGPWVLLGNQSGFQPAAIVHAQQLGGASDFFVLLSLPGGRDKTLRLLEQLRVFDYLRMNQQLKYFKRKGNGIGLEFVPDLPSVDEKHLETWQNSLFPAGTRVALVRQMRVLDTTGYAYPTRIVESIQLRVYRDALLSPQYPTDSDDPRFNIALPPPSQDAYEIRLDRQALASGAPNSLRSVTIDEYTLDANFINGTPLPAEIRPTGAAPPHHARQQVHRTMDSCGMCHGAPGLHSFMTFSRGLMTGEPLPKLHDSSSREDEEIRGERLQRYGRGYLQALWGTVHD